MESSLTIDEISDRFDSEWILVEDPETDADLQVLRGKVIAHSKDRDEVYRHAADKRPKRFAILYTGTPPANTAIVL
jgi:hypothetical protein